MTPQETFKALGFTGDDLERLTCHEDSYNEFLAECMKKVYKMDHVNLIDFDIKDGTMTRWEEASKAWRKTRSRVFMETFMMDNLETKK